MGEKWVEKYLLTGEIWSPTSAIRPCRTLLSDRAFSQQNPAYGPFHAERESRKSYTKPNHVSLSTLPGFQIVYWLCLSEWKSVCLPFLTWGCSIVPFCPSYKVYVANALAAFDLLKNSEWHDIIWRQRVAILLSGVRRLLWSFCLSVYVRLWAGYISLERVNIMKPRFRNCAFNFLF